MSNGLQAGITERVRDQFQRIIIVMDLGIKVSEVESISDILLVNLAEVLIPLAAQEPGHPRIRVVAVASRALEFVHR